MTLLDHKTWKIPDSAMEAIERMRGRHRIVLRHRPRHGQPLQRGPQGADTPGRHRASERDEGDRRGAGDFRAFLFQGDAYRQLLTYCDAAGYGMGITVGWEDFYTHPEVISAMDLARWGRSDRDFKDWRKLLEMPVRTRPSSGNESRRRI